MNSVLLDNLKDLVYKGAKNKSLSISDLVLDRLSYELKIIEEKGFTDYFILYSRIIEICNEQNLIRSYGRGSAPASLMNYCLDITNINPLEHNFRFEKFIHPLQKRLPDIDIDIPEGYRDDILNLLISKYPEYHNYSLLVPIDTNIINSEIIEYDDYKFKKHACGAILTTELIEKSTYNAENEKFYICKDYYNDPVLEYKFDFVELVKLRLFQILFSFLGKDYHPNNLPIDDLRTFEFLHTEKGYDTFGFISDNIFEKFKPKSIQDLTMIFAMNRKPLSDLISKVIENKNSSTTLYKWTDKRVNDILDETYGVVIYQETFTDLMIEIAGYDFIDAENWRKTFSTQKDKNISTSFTIDFYKKCKENSILSESEISKLATIILETAKWTFQKTHSISHSLIGYWDAYYKVHFPKEYEKALNSF